MEPMSARKLAERLERLRALAGGGGSPPSPPTFKAIERWAAQIHDPGMRDAKKRPVRPPVLTSIQAWCAGDAVPAKWEPFSLVLEALIEKARVAHRQPPTPGLYDMAAWKRAWESARQAPPAPEDSPYRGLTSFQPRHRGFFFGRTADVTALVQHLDSALTAPGGLLALVAPSGVGKTSLLQAGLVPALEDNGLPSAPESTTWPTRVLTPGQRPLATLEHHIPTLAGVLRTGVEGGPAVDRAPDAGAVRAAVAEYTAEEAGPGSRLILVIDQFEEVFTLCGESERRTFIDVLRAAATPEGEEDPAPALVMIGLRSDFYTNCVGDPVLQPALEHHQKVLAPMSISQLTEAIEGPAAAARVKVEPELVQRLLQDAGLVGADGTATGRPNPGVLPLVSHSLRATWEKRSGARGPLTVKNYLATGGIQGAVKQTADKAWGKLNHREQRAGMAMLMKLTRIGDEDGQDTRRPCGWRELVASASDPAATTTARDAMVAARLITVDSDTVQIAHEALLRSWPLLTQTLDERRSGLVQRQRVEEAAATWAQSQSPHWWRRGRDHRDARRLYGVVDLKNAERWRDTADVDAGPSDLAREFLDRSSRQRARDRWRVRVFGVLLIGLAVGTSLEWRQASVQEDAAQFGQVVAEADRLRGTDVSLAAQLDLTAYRMRRDDPDLYTNLITTENVPLATPLLGHVGIVRSVAVSADGKILVSAGDDKTVRLWNVADPHRPTALGQPLSEPSPVYAVALSPDGKTLVDAGADGVVRRWNITDPARPTRVDAPLPTDAGAVWGLSFSPDGRTLVSQGADGLGRLWNVVDPSHPAPLGDPLPGGARTFYGSGLAFSSDGRTLAIAGAGATVRLWNVADPAHPAPLGAPLAGGSRVTYAVAFSPDGRTLVSAGGDNVMRLWNVSDLSHPTLIGQPLTARTSSILAVAFSPDGKTVASASADDTVTLWDTADPAHAIPLGEPLVGHTRGVGAVRFSPDGRTLVTGSADATVRLWSLPSTRLVGPAGNVTSVALSHSGRTLAVASADDSVRLWDVTRPDDPEPVGPVLHQDGFLNAVAFSPDDKVLASGGNGRTVRLWNIADPRQASALGPDLGFPGEVGGLTISPDGRVLAVGCGDGAVRLFSVADPSRPTPLGPPLMQTPGKLVGTVKFSPDGTVLASAGADHAVWLWNVADQAQPRAFGRPLRKHTDQVYQLAFSPDGTTLASASADHTVRLWSVADPARATELGQPLTQHTNAVGGVAYSSDGKTLASGSDDQTLLLWNVADPAHASPVGQPLTGHTNFIYTVAFGPDGRTLVSGGRDHTVLLWQLDVEHAIARICATTANDLTPAAWNTYVSPALPYDPPCP